MITGKQARDLLDAAETPAPWQVARQETPHGHVSQVVGPVEKTNMRFDFIPVVATNMTETDAALAAASPDLAATLAWLYGREADDEAVWDDHYEVSVTADKRVAVFDHDATTTYFTPDEAIEFARALIAAAEQARHE